MSLSGGGSSLSPTLLLVGTQELMGGIISIRQGLFHPMAAKQGGVGLPGLGGQVEEEEADKSELGAGRAFQWMGGP